MSFEKKFGEENITAKKLNIITKNNFHFFNCAINLKYYFIIYWIQMNY